MTVPTRKRTSIPFSGIDVFFLRWKVCAARICHSRAQITENSWKTSTDRLGDLSFMSTQRVFDRFSTSKYSILFKVLHVLKLTGKAPPPFFWVRKRWLELSDLICAELSDLTETSVSHRGTHCGPNTILVRYPLIDVKKMRVIGWSSWPREAPRGPAQKRSSEVTSVIASQSQLKCDGDKERPPGDILRNFHSLFVALGWKEDAVRLASSPMSQRKLFRFCALWFRNSRYLKSSLLLSDEIYVRKL